MAKLQEKRHEVLIGSGFIGTQTYLPQKLSFTLDFGHFILKMLKKIKFSYNYLCQEKDPKYVA